MADRLALIIANSEFDDPTLARLATPSQDAKTLAEVLGHPDIGGFKVAVLVDKPLRLVRSAVARFYHRRRRDDLLFFYYSGHGFKDDYGELYFAVKDTEREVLSATALDAVFVRRQLDQSNSQRKVVILDCCHSGAFVPGGKAILGSNVGAGEALAGSGYGRVILTASNAVEYSWEGDQPLGEPATSTFTHFLVHGLRTGEADRDQDGRVSLDELYDYVYEQVVTSERSRQTPQKWTQKVEGQILIARNPNPVIKPAELPSELQQAVESPFAEVREGSVRTLDRLLHGSDKGLAQAAQEALELLLNDDSRSVSAAAARALRISSERIAEKPVSTLPPPVGAEQAEHKRVSEPRRRPVLLLGRPIPWYWIAGAGLAALALIVVVFVLTGGFGKDGDKALSPADKTATAVAAIPARTEILKPTATSTPTYTPTGTPPPIITVAPAIETWTATPSNTPTPSPSATPELGIGSTTTRDRDGATMVYVRGGTFQMGSTEGEDDEQPVHSVTLDSFWIDKYEVTNAQYRQCVETGACDAPTTCAWGEPTYEDAKKVEHPVVCVDWFGARDYCEWAGARLPTEAEWEYAARGKERFVYPWGNEFDCSRGNFDDETQVNDYVVPGGEGCDQHKKTAPVGSFPDGASWCEALDMAGNVFEWVNDWYDGDYYDVSQVNNPSGPEKSGTERVVRGGSWYSNVNNVRSASRDSNPPGGAYYNWGFRCVGDSTSSP